METRSMLRERILIIDDEPDAISVLRFALERAGFEVLSVTAPSEALPLAIESAPHLILLALEIGARHSEAQHSDFRWPDARPEDRRSSESRGVESRGGEGARLCRLLRGDAHTCHLPIVLVTGKLRADMETVEGFKAGADDYVMKPFRPADVVARVRSLLDRKRDAAESSPYAMPGATAIENRLREALEGGETFGALHTDLLGFSDFNARHGTQQGDSVLQIVAATLREAASFIDPDAFIGHAGADRFVLLTTSAKMETLARNIIARYETAMRTFMETPTGGRDSAAQSASVTAHDSSGRPHEYLWPRLALAGVSNETRRFRNPLEIASVALEVKKALRNRPDSSYLKDRRGGEYDPQRAPTQAQDKSRG